MASITFFLDKADLDTFKASVGEGNISPTLRNFVKSYGEGKELSEKKVQLLFTIEKEKYDKQKAKYERLKTKLEAIKEKKREEELKRVEKEVKFRQKMTDIEYETRKKDLWRTV